MITIKPILVNHSLIFDILFSLLESAEYKLINQYRIEYKHIFPWYKSCGVIKAPFGPFHRHGQGVEKPPDCPHTSKHGTAWVSTHWCGHLNTESQVWEVVPLVKPSHVIEWDCTATTSKMLDFQSLQCKIGKKREREKKSPLLLPNCIKT